jgi:hypothetical protein
MKKERRRGKERLEEAGEEGTVEKRRVETAESARSQSIPALANKK